jgi:type VI secretion system FHA domain protein
MSLTLEVQGPEARKLGAASRKVFDTQGGTIGRLADNSWVLPDRYVSGHHARIRFASGTYYVEDTSSNGICLNSPDARLPKNQPQALKNGDRLYIDAYEIRVSITPDAPAVSPVPVAGASPRTPDPSPLAGLFETPAAPPAIPADPFASDDPFGSTMPAPGSASPVPRRADPIIPAGPVEEETDPLALLGLTPKATPPAGPRAEQLSRSPLVEAYQPPAVPPARPPAPAADPVSGGLIPDDYDPLGRDDAPARAAATTPPEAPASGPRPTPGSGRSGPTSPRSTPVRSVWGSPSPPEAAPEPPRPAPIVTTVMPPQSGAAPPAIPTAGRSTSGLAAESAAAPGPVRSPSGPRVESPASASAGSSVDLATLLAAAGVPDAAVTPELAESFGRILRVVVAGLMDLMRARERIKDEFRMRMTTFKAVDNNPLKFSANVEDALHNLLVKRNAAYLPPVEAFEDAFQDARNSQVAMLAGLRVAFEAMLADFDPERLQEQFDRQLKKGALLSAPARFRYWELYRDRYAETVKDADSAFRELFGEKFGKAYEEQMLRLKTASRASRRT